MRPIMYMPSGAEISFIDPNPDSIEISDIDDVLSHLQRFNGMLCTSFTVAEHLLSCKATAEAMGLSVRDQLWLLMHDAHEAFTGDIPSPLKGELGGIRILETKLDTAISKALGLPAPDSPIEELKYIDKQSAVHEALTYGPSCWHDNYVTMLDKDIPFKLEKHPYPQGLIHSAYERLICQI